MFVTRLKHWALGIFNGNSQNLPKEVNRKSREDILYSSLRLLQEKHSLVLSEMLHNDPRELPRPTKHSTSTALWTRSDTLICTSDKISSQCNCSNCVEITSHLVECPICLGSIISHCNGHRSEVYACMECGNIACHECAQKLHRCPYCREENGLQPNVGLQRLINKLKIPCRYTKWGCREHLGESDGEEHESVCHFAPVLCPRKNCTWRGKVEELAKHLETVHLFTILDGTSVTLEIADFARKAKQSETRPRHYTVMLSCFSNIFICKALLNHGKLKIMLLQTTKSIDTQFAGWIEIKCEAKTMKGIFPIAENQGNIEISADNLTTKRRSDRVCISITIRPLS